MLVYALLLVPFAAALHALRSSSVPAMGRSGVAAALASAVLVSVVVLAVFLGHPVPGAASWTLDRLNALMLALVEVVYLGAAFSSARYIGEEYASGILPQKKARLYYALLPLFVAAMLTAVTTDHLGMLWVALEFTTLATTPLVALYKKDGAVEAAWKYLLLCSVGISVSLLGLLLFAYAGARAGLPMHDALSLGALRDRAELLDPQVVQWAFVFLFVGIGTKVGFVPMHPWLPDAHSRTPSPISAMLSGVLLNIALYALLRGKGIVDLALGQGDWTAGLFRTFGLISILFAAFVLLRQQNYKRMLAYSSVEHMGLIAFAVSMGPAGAAGAVMHMVGHTLAKSTLFFSAGEVLLGRHTTKIENIRGLWGTAPRTSFLFLLGFLGLIGAPTSIVFASELTMLVAAAQRSPVAALVVLASLAMVAIGLLHHVFAMLFTGDEAAADPARTGTPEAFTVTHAVVAIELTVLFAGGLFCLSGPGFALAASIAGAFTLQP